MKLPINKSAVLLRYVTEYAVIGNFNLCAFPSPYKALRVVFILQPEAGEAVFDRLEAEQPGMLDSYGGISLHGQSHGESFLALVHNRFWGQGLYLLDEPEAALSPARQLTLLAEIHRLVQKGSQFLIATHSPILMAYPQGQILLLGQGPIHPVEYRETEHYQITKNFLDDPQRMLRVLFEPDEQEETP